MFRNCWINSTLLYPIPNPLYTQPYIYQVYIIVVGQEPAQPEVRDMCDYPPQKHFFQVPDYDRLKTVEDQLIQMLCDGKLLDFSKVWIDSSKN